LFLLRVEESGIEEDRVFGDREKRGMFFEGLYSSARIFWNKIRFLEGIHDNRTGMGHFVASCHSRMARSVA
jgi:hypothetical protein